MKEKAITEQIIMDGILQCKEDLIKKIYAAATGDELTVNNAPEVQLASRVGDYEHELIAIRGEVLGLITVENINDEGGYKIQFRFDPTQKRFPN